MGRPGECPPDLPPEGPVRRHDGRVNRRHLVVVLVGALALVGAGATAWANRTPAPLPPLAVETLAPPAGIDLPVHVVAGGDDGAAFSLDSPTSGTLFESILTLPLADLPVLSSLGVNWVPLSGAFSSVEAFTDWQRRHPEDAQFGGDLVIEHSALGAAVRKDLAMTSGVTLTQWAVEHDGYLYLVEWMHHPDDDTDRPTVEAMIASWRWS